MMGDLFYLLLVKNPAAFSSSLSVLLCVPTV